MRKFLLLWLVGLMLVPSVMAERKKVGLVLGGGGAKGVAHIGVLKVLEEARLIILPEPVWELSLVACIPLAILPLRSIAWYVGRIGACC